MDTSSAANIALATLGSPTKSYLIILISNNNNNKNLADSMLTERHSILHHSVKVGIKILRIK